MPQVNGEDNIVFHSNEEFPHVRGSGYNNQPSYHAAPYEHNEIDKYANIYKYDWEEFEKSQRENNPMDPSIEPTNINNHNFNTDDDEETIMASRRSSIDASSNEVEGSSDLSDKMFVRHQVPPPMLPTTTTSFMPSIFEPLTTTPPPPRIPVRNIPRRNVFVASVEEADNETPDVATTTPPPQTTTLDDISGVGLFDDEVVTNPPLKLHPFPSKPLTSNLLSSLPSGFIENNPNTFNHIPFTLMNSNQMTPVSTESTTLTPPTTISSMSSMNENDEIMTDPPQFINIGGRIMPNPTSFTVNRVNNNLPDDEVVMPLGSDDDLFETTTPRSVSNIHEFISFRQPMRPMPVSSPPTIQLSSLVPRPESTATRKPIGLFRNKLLEAREQMDLKERLRKQQLDNIRNKKPVVIKFTG